MPDFSTLIKKSDYDTKIKEIESKYVSDAGFDSKLAQANVITKRNFDVKITEVENNIKKLKTFDSSYSMGKNYFDENGTQNYLVFQAIFRYFEINTINNTTNYVSSWQSKGLSTEVTKPPSTSDNSLKPILSYYLASRVRVKFSGSCLKQDKITFAHGNVVNIDIVYELCASSSKNSDPTIKSSLFGAVTLTTNPDIDKYRYSGYGIGFDRRSNFSFPGGGFGQNIIMFGTDINSSPHIDNKGKDILIPGRGPPQELGEHSLTAERIYSINFTLTKKKICLNLHYNGANIYLFVNGTEIIKFKAKNSSAIANPLCLRNISKDWSTDNMKRTGFTGHVYDFSADYNCIWVDDIKNIHKYLMEKNDRA